MEFSTQEWQMIIGMPLMALIFAGMAWWIVIDLDNASEKRPKDKLSN